MKRGKLVAVLVLAALVAGCVSSTGKYPGQSTTNVDLSNANYRVLKSGAKGTSTGFTLFWFLRSSLPAIPTRCRMCGPRRPWKGGPRRWPT